MSEKPIQQPSEYITVSVRRINHTEIKKYLEEIGDGTDIGKFYDKAAIDRLHKLKIRNTPFDLISTDTFLKAGWEKTGSSTYKRGEQVAMYTGTWWYVDGTQLTKDNWYEHIGDKTKAKFNPNLPQKSKQK
jgi:hypothetical protein